MVFHGNFCDDILFNILVHVPAQFLHQQRFMNKQWFRMISDPFFVEAHLARSLSGLVTISQLSSAPKRQDQYSLMVADESNNSIRVDDQFLYVPPKTTILSSCNGLLLLRGSGGRVSLFNPVTRKDFPLPPFAYAPSNVGGGIIFNPHTKDYTLVVFYNLRIGELFKCKILSLVKHGKLTWRDVHCRFNEFEWCTPPVLARDSTLYWCSYDRTYLVSLEINHGDAKFGRVEIPEDMSSGSKGCKLLMDMGGRPSIVITRGLKHDIWVLDDDHELRKWARMRTISLGWWDAQVVGSLGDGKVIIFKIQGEGLCIAYDVEHGKGKQFKCIDMGENCILNYALAHVSSLVSWDDQVGCSKQVKKKRKWVVKPSSKSVHWDRATDDGRVRVVQIKDPLLETPNRSRGESMCKRRRMLLYSKLLVAACLSATVELVEGPISSPNPLTNNGAIAEADYTRPIRNRIEPKYMSDYVGLDRNGVSQYSRICKESKQ